MRSRAALLAAFVAAAPAVGCGEGVEPISGDGAPAVTSPGTTAPYETGGADGSGADGRAADEPAGGIAAGRDVGSGG